MTEPHGEVTIQLASCEFRISDRGPSNGRIATLGAVNRGQNPCWGANRLGSKSLSRLVHSTPMERRRHCDSTSLRLAAIGPLVC